MTVRSTALSIVLAAAAVGTSCQSGDTSEVLDLKFAGSFFMGFTDARPPHIGQAQHKHEIVGYAIGVREGGRASEEAVP